MDMQVALPRIPSTIDRCIEILQRTHDGNALAPRHLKLVEMMCNASVCAVSEAAEIVFDDLYRRVADGSYDHTKVWFHDIEHLTRDHEGYVLWRDRIVEHYSFRDYDGEHAAALALAERCRSLEARGLPVNGATVTQSIYNAMPANSPYLPIISRLYTVFSDENGLAACLIVRLPDDCARALHYEGDTLIAQDFDGCYDAFHGCGFGRSFGNLLHDYESAVEVLESGRFTPEAVAPFLV